MKLSAAVGIHNICAEGKLLEDKLEDCMQGGLEEAKPGRLGRRQQHCQPQSDESRSSGAEVEMEREDLREISKQE